MNPMMFGVVGRVLAACLLSLVVVASRVVAADALENGLLQADFDGRGLTAIHDAAARKTVRFAQDGFAVFAGNESLESDFLTPTLEQQSPTNRVYRFESRPWMARVVYELEPCWQFVSKQVVVVNSGKKDFRVQRLELQRGRRSATLFGCKVGQLTARYR